MYQRNTRGFTLIEVLVVTAVIGLLSSVTLANLNEARSRSGDTNRIQSMEQFRDALELYYIDHGTYPKTINPGEGDTYDSGYGGFLFVPAKRVGECWASTDSEGYMDPSVDIPGFVPTYMPRWPTDPNLSCEGVTHSWFYASDGVDYKLITHTQNPQEFNQPLRSTIDPVWDEGPDVCTLDGTNAMHVGYWTPGATCWNI
jgi:prepilin-type N-terminal cleavage/methylation domain-containing protein